MSNLRKDLKKVDWIIEQNNLIYALHGEFVEDINYGIIDFFCPFEDYLSMKYDQAYGDGMDRDAALISDFIKRG